MKVIPKTIKTVIFDLGDVILPLDKEKMYKAFEQLGGKKVSEQFDSPAGHAIYQKYEHTMPTTVFREAIRTLLKLPNIVTDAQIDHAWSALLLPIPPERLAQLQQLRDKDYEVILLSNSNDIHYDVIQKQYKGKFEQIFHHQHYSHLIRKAKPNADAFQYVLGKRDPETVIFFDDKQVNTDAAKALGIFAVQFTTKREINEVQVEIAKANAVLHEKARRKQIGSYVKIGFFSAVAVASVAILTSVLTSSPRKPS